MLTRRLLLPILLLSLTLTHAVAKNLLLTGTPIGSQSVDYNTGAPSNTVNTCTNAFDGDPDTYFASYERSLTWVGLDLGTAHVVSRIGWMPRKESDGPQRTVLGVFEGANRPDFMDAVPLHLISEAQPAGTMTYADVYVSKGFRYVRYVGPHDARCNIAELVFYGHEGEGDETCFAQLTNLPTITIHTTDAVDPYDKEHDLEALIQLIYDGGTHLQSLSGTTRLRGNASMGHPKKPYRIKLAQSAHLLKGSPLRSPAKAKKWTLINNYSDKTLMRNLVAFEMGRRMGFDYVPWSTPVDVILNGEYRGCYQLTDQLTVDKNRVNITEMSPADNEGEALTGGYLVELDGYASQETSWFTSLCGNPITIKSPSDSDITPQQYNYIQNSFNAMEASILADGPSEGFCAFRDRMDEGSLIRYFLTEEVTGNPDAFWSCYLTKERCTDTFKVGPIWDFDIAFDNDYRYFPCNDQGDFLSLARGGAGNSRSLLKRIFLDDVFRDSLCAVWQGVRQSGLITPESATAYIDSMASVLQQSQRLNFIRWPILDTKVQVNPRAAGTYEGEVQWLREFMQARIPWMDRQVRTSGNQGSDIYMEIATAQQLVEFASLVNSGMTKARARLTADIDLSSQPALMIGATGDGYAGDFDGAGHSITLAMKRDAENAALFMSLTGCVHDLTVQGTISTTSKYAAGIAAVTTGATIQRCQSMVGISSTLQGDGTHGGIVGVSNDGTVIEDCLVQVQMQGDGTTCCGGVVGWASGSTRISNCLVTGNITVSASGSDLLARNSGNVTSVNNYACLTWGAPCGCSSVQALTAIQVSGGEACFLLNSTLTEHQHWFQTLSEDLVPIPNNRHATVYSTAHLHCDGTPYVPTGAYSNNTKFDQRDAHTLVNGFCTVCGAMDIYHVPRDARGYYELPTAQHLLWFAQQVEAGTTDLCGVLTADVNLSSQSDFMIGRSRPFAGVLDGAGHSITIAQKRSENYAGLVGHLTGTLQDLVVRGSINTSGKFAGLVGEMLGGKMVRCQSHLDIQASINGDGTHGGLVGLVSESSKPAQIRNSLFAGSIQGSMVTCCGGLVGWASAMYILSDCLMIGDMYISTDGCNMLARNPSTAILSNCYYQSAWQSEVPDAAQEVSEDALASGEACYLLNHGVTDGTQAWYQDLARDLYPTPDRTLPTVYHADDTFTNTLPDAIHTTMASNRQSTGTALYDLSGRRVTRPTRGIYVQGGRLVVK